MNTIQEELERLNKRLDFFKNKLVEVCGNSMKELAVRSKIRPIEQEIERYEIILHTIYVESKKLQ